MREGRRRGEGRGDRGGVGVGGKWRESGRGEGGYMSAAPKILPSPPHLCGGHGCIDLPHLWSLHLSFEQRCSRSRDDWSEVPKPL